MKISTKIKEHGNSLAIFISRDLYTFESIKIDKKWAVLFSKFLTIVKNTYFYFLYSQINLIFTYYISKKKGVRATISFIEEK